MGLCLSFLAATFLFSNYVRAAGETLNIRTGEHDGYSRIVFDWGKSVGYQAYRSGNILDVVFKAQDGKIDLQKFNTRTLSGLRAVKQVQSPLDVTHIRMALPAGIKHRHYRIGQSIVFDLYKNVPDAPQGKDNKPEKIRPQPQKIIAAIPTELPEKPPRLFQAEPETAQAETPRVTLTEKAPVKTPAEMLKNIQDVAEKVVETLTPEKEIEMPEPSFTASVSEGPQAAKVSVAKIEQEILPSHLTTITLSTIEPASLAAFERFGELWLVVDTKFASIAPHISGPLADKLGTAQKKMLRGGVAYHMTMPTDIEVAKVRYANLSWIVALREKQGQVENFKTGQVRRNIRPGKAPSAELFLPGAHRVLKLHSDRTGEDLFVATSSRAGSHLSLTARYPQFEIFPAYQGAVVKPYDDDLDVGARKSYVTIESPPEGVIMTQDIAELPLAKVSDVGNVHPDDRKAQEANRLFDFHGWRKGGLKYLRENQRHIESKLADAKKGAEAASVFLEMALLYFSNGYGQETIGALRAAAMENPELTKNPGFLAIKGGAEALSGFSLEALRDLSVKELEKHPEARLWAGYAAAASEQWGLAGRLFPKENGIASTYPPHFAIPFTLYMAESALRLGDTVRARGLLNSIESFLPDMTPQHKAAMNYLKGEAYRQEGEVIRALRAWYPVENGRDRLYHAKAALATVGLRRKIKRMTDEDALDRLESLRYAWRGDGLEIQILHKIANLHLDNKRYIPGLREMRRAVDLAENIFYDSSALVRDMSHVYSDLYVHGQADALPPFEAVAIYNSFKELMPAGYDSLIAEQNYTDYLVEMDLLEDATTILEKQIKEDLEKPQEISQVGARLASIYLQDSKPRQALSAIQRTGRKNLPKILTEKRELLRARALSDMGLKNQAIETLKPYRSKDAVKLTADIYWKAKNWKYAAETLEKILPKPQELATGNNAEDRKLVLNAAVAYKLAGDEAAVKKIRDAYMPSMKPTEDGAAFAVVTRKKSGTPSLKDRQTVLNLASEVDIFKSFLDDYKMDNRF